MGVLSGSLWLLPGFRSSGGVQSLPRRSTTPRSSRHADDALRPGPKRAVSGQKTAQPANIRRQPYLRHKTRALPRTAPSWMEEAACASHDDPDLWFAERGEEERRQEALDICATCPVRAACLAYVLSMPPQSGIWGGTTEDQRTRDRRRASARCGRAS
jgi:transcription factor WhiB